MKNEALLKVIAHLGSAKKLADALDITPAAVSLWKRVPAERVLAVEQATGYVVTRHELRPDLYPEEAPRRGRKKRVA